MKSQVIVSREVFENELVELINEGDKILSDFNKINESADKFERIEVRQKSWKSQVKEFLKQRFDNPENEYLKSFEYGNGLNFSAMSDIQRGASPQDINYRYRHFLTEFKPQLDNLLTLKTKLRYMKFATMEETKVNAKEFSEPKVFISHSSKDRHLVEQVISLLEAMGLKSEQIFCSSFEGYGIALGDDFLEVIKEKLDNNVLVLFILSEDFYRSPICLCEMGATWVKTSAHVPIVIPPLGFSDIKGVIPNTQGMMVNDLEKMNSLKTKIESFFNLPSAEINIWERKRNKISNEITHILNQTNNFSSSPLKKKEKPIQNKKIKGTKEPNNLNELLKARGKQKWPKDFDMQLHYIKSQRLALNEFNILSSSAVDITTINNIKAKAKREWPNDYEMQLHTAKNQINSLEELNNM